MDDIKERTRGDSANADIPPDPAGYDAPVGKNEECADFAGGAEPVEEVEGAEAGENEEEKLNRADRKRLRRLESEYEGLKKQLETAARDMAALNDKYLRMIAEYDNYRKRTAKEKETSYTDACADTAASLLPVLDNLERAALYRDSERVAQGVEMTLRSFGESFARLGITEIGKTGEKFDPCLHNAVLHIEDECYGEGEIVEVLQKGYALGERILRFAMVKVAN